jgi:hypothetical protein
MISNHWPSLYLSFFPSSLVPQEVKKVVVAVDDSDAAKHALIWAVDTLVGPKDELHLLSVALPVPFTVSATVHFFLFSFDSFGFCFNWSASGLGVLLSVLRLTHFCFFDLGA